MLHDQELQDDKNSSPRNRNRHQKAAAAAHESKQNDIMIGNGLQRQKQEEVAANPQYMIMNNMESDTEEVYVQGKTYKKMGTNDLKRGLTTQREGKKQQSGSIADMLQGSKIDVEKF